jgi:transcription termination factor Rho
MVRDFSPTQKDPLVPQRVIQKFGLREGCVLEVRCEQRKGRNEVSEVMLVNGMTPQESRGIPELTRLTAVTPSRRIQLDPGDTTTRFIDLVAPLGYGQRALIVAPPRSGKTMMLQSLARAVHANHPDIELLILLIDERPEEVTEMERAVPGRVFASSNDHDFSSHNRVARLTLEYAKRRVEAGHDVLILLDSLTRLGRAYNVGTRGSGRIMSGGIDARALEIPKRIFGASRSIEHGGSLTIVATILTDTGSRMDELIFQEFKGTGNSEIVLDRELADLRIYPPIDVQKSGTRREELLFGDLTEAHHRLRRMLVSGTNKQAVEALQELLRRYPGNTQLLTSL